MTGIERPLGYECLVLPGVEQFHIVRPGGCRGGPGWQIPVAGEQRTMQHP